MTSWTLRCLALCILGAALVPGVHAQPAPIDIDRPCFRLAASDFWIQLNDGRIFNLNPAEASNIQIHCDPGNNSYTTIEVTWHQHGVLMRFFAYLRSDGSSWWSDELRIYDGGAQSDWLYAYGDFFRSPRGQPFQAVSWETTADSGTGNATNGLPGGQIHFGNLELIAFHQVVQAITPGSQATDAGTPATQPIDAASPAIQPPDAPQHGAKSTGIVMPDLGRAFGTPLGIAAIGAVVVAAGFGSFAVGRRHARNATPVKSTPADPGRGGMPGQVPTRMPKTLLVWSLVLGIPLMVVGVFALYILAQYGRTAADIVGLTIGNFGVAPLLVAGVIAAVPVVLFIAYLVARKRWKSRQQAGIQAMWQHVPESAQPTPASIAPQPPTRSRQASQPLQAPPSWIEVGHTAGAAPRPAAASAPAWIDLGPLPAVPSPDESPEWIDLGPLPGADDKPRPRKRKQKE